jgi:membrane protease YdiL (CAAX protease family)
MLASLVFGLLHALTATYAVLATFMGVYLGAVWLGTGNLLVVVLAHALYDFAALVYLTRGPQLR